MNGKVCGRCQREMYPKTNGVIVIEHAKSIPGPYKLWEADLWAYHGCDAEVVVGFAKFPIAEHFQPGFKTILEAAKQNRTCVDCFERPV
jgi:hypothetical protein